MIKLFTYDFSKEEKFNAKKYLEALKNATENGKLYIARNIDFADGLYNEVAVSAEDTNAVSVINIDWNKYDIHKLLYKFDCLIEEIEKAKEKENIFETKILSTFASSKHFLLNQKQWNEEWDSVKENAKKDSEKIYAPEFYCFPSICAKRFENRINRLNKLLEMNAPKIVIENEKHSLFETMIFYYCADRYHTVKLEDNYCAVNPEKGRVDVENEKFVMQFLEVYQDIAQFVKDNVEVTTAQIQKHFKIGYSFMIYALDMLEDNCLVVEWQGKFKDTGLKLDDANEIVINTKPFKRDDKFLDQMGEQELLNALEKLNKKK